MGKKSVSHIVSDTIEAIFQVLQSYVSLPETEEQWKNIALEFGDLWEFSHMVGVIDGKHVVIEAPAKSGSFYHNYKGTFSIVLLAVCVAKYFTLVDVIVIVTLYFLVGDEIFLLKPWLLCLYPGRLLKLLEMNYNYRDSRARRVIENAFGILRAHWRIFSHPVKASVQNTERYVMACLCLHNYLCQTENSLYTPQGFVDGELADGKIEEGE